MRSRGFLVAWVTVIGIVSAFASTGNAADDAKEFAALKYRNVGPFAGGRVSRACGVPGDPLVYFAATASGGVWKSTDGGHAWKSVFDDQPTSSIGSIALAPSDTNVVYVGSGEANIRGNVSPGAGMFKSTDAGKTWKHVRKQVGQIGTVAVHPKNADIAFAAVLGHAFGPNAERGVPHHGRRPHLGPRALQERGHRRERYRHRPEQPARRVRWLLANTTPPVGDDERRPWLRPVCFTRRWRYLGIAA